MDYLFRAKDGNGNLVYGSVVYGRVNAEYCEDDEKKTEFFNTRFFINDIEYSEKLELIYDDDDAYFPDEEYYDDWQVQVVEIDWDTLEFNLNGKWIKYEVKK